MLLFLSRVENRERDDGYFIEHSSLYRLLFHFIHQTHTHVDSRIHNSPIIERIIKRQHSLLSNLYYKMYSRSLTERIRIRLEIFYENFVDFLGQNALRKPMVILAGVAMFVTLRNSKHVISKLKHSTYLSPFNSRYGSSSSSLSLYGSAASSLYGGGASTASQYGNTNRMAASTSTAGGYGGSSTYGGTMSYGNPQYNSNPASSSTYAGMGASSSTYQQPYGQNTASTTYGTTSNLRGAQSTPNSFSTSRLVEQYSGSVQVVQGGLFHDYGGLTSFSGQVETLSSMESPTFVQQSLSSPGNGKILVVDGRGSFNGAVFDASMANVALSNGWKGIIINGVVRNAEELKSIQFGVKALGAHPSPGLQQTPGQVGAPLSFGGVNVSPGNYVYADTEGIVVSATSLGGVGGGLTTQSTTGYASTNTFGAAATSTGMGGSAYSNLGQTNSYGATQGRAFSSAGQMNSYSTPQSNSYSQGYPSNNALSTGMGATGSNYGGSTPYASSSYSSNSSPYASTNRSPYSRGSSSSYGRHRKRPSKKTLLGLLLLVVILGWICMND